MKKFIFVLLGLLVAAATAGAQTASVSDKVSGSSKTTMSGNNYTTVSSRSASSSDIKTEFTWSNEKDNVGHPIYLHKYTRGDKAGKWTTYVFRTSKKTGKEYKYYLPDGEAIAQDIIKRNPNLIK